MYPMSVSLEHVVDPWPAYINRNDIEDEYLAYLMISFEFDKVPLNSQTSFTSILDSLLSSIG